MRKTLRILGLLAALYLLLLNPNTVGSQGADEPEVPVDGPAAVTVDFTFHGLIFVSTKVNGKGPFQFMFDSGATQTVVASRLATELKLKLHEMPGEVQGVGTAEAELAVLDSLAIGDFRRDKPLAISMNLDHLSDALGWRVGGIIGQNVIRFMKKIEIDFSVSKLSMTPFPAGEEPSNLMEEIIRGSLEGGGGDNPLPFPFPKPGDGKGGDDGEEEYSVLPETLPAAVGCLIAQEAEAEEGTAPQPNPDRQLSVTYKAPSIPTIPLLMKEPLELIPYWYLDAEVNGETRKMMFDTGASMLVVLGDKMARELDVPTSYSYPVSGIGVDTAVEGIVEEFSVGGFSVSDQPCTVLKLPRFTDQLPEFARELLPLLKGLGVDLTLDFDGIVGLPLALRYKKMTVFTAEKRIEFEPYAKDEINTFAPYEQEAVSREACIRVWNGRAGAFGITGHTVALQDREQLKSHEGGMIIDEVEPDSAAAKAGIKAGDVLLKLVDVDTGDGETGDIPVPSLPTLVLAGCMLDPSSKVKVLVVRGGKEITIEVTLDDYGWEGEAPPRFAREE